MNLAAIHTVWQWELRTFFRRPAHWLVLAVAVLTAACATTWLIALVALQGLPARLDDDPIRQFLGPNLFLVGTVMWVAPLLTMNLVAEDRRRGSWELLVTSPTALADVLLGKFLAGWTVLATCLAPWPVFLLVLSLWNGRATWWRGWCPWPAGAGFDIEPGVLVGGTVGLLVFSGVLAAWGTLTSAWSRRPLMAALAMAGWLGLLLVITLALQWTGDGRLPGGWTHWLRPWGVWHHLAEYSRGAIPVRRLAQQAALITATLWLAHRTCRWVDGGPR